MVRRSASDSSRGGGAARSAAGRLSNAGYGVCAPAPIPPAVAAVAMAMAMAAIVVRPTKGATLGRFRCAGALIA